MPESTGTPATGTPPEISDGQWRMIHAALDLLYIGSPLRALDRLLPLVGWSAGVDQWLTFQHDYRDALEFEPVQPSDLLAQDALDEPWVTSDGEQLADPDAVLRIHDATESLYEGRFRDAAEKLLPLIGRRADVDAWLSSERVHRKAQGCRLLEPIAALLPVPAAVPAARRTRKRGER